MLITKQLSIPIAQRFQSGLGGLFLGLQSCPEIFHFNIRSVLNQGIQSVTQPDAPLPYPVTSPDRISGEPLHYLPWIWVLLGDRSSQSVLVQRIGESNPKLTATIVFLIQVMDYLHNDLYHPLPNPFTTSDRFIPTSFQTQADPIVEQTWSLLNAVQRDRPTLSQGLPQWDSLRDDPDLQALSLAVWLTLRSNTHFSLSLAQVPACGRRFSALLPQLFAYTGLLAGFVNLRIPLKQLPIEDRFWLETQSDRLFRAWTGQPLGLIN